MSSLAILVRAIQALHALVLLSLSLCWAEEPRLVAYYYKESATELTTELIAVIILVITQNWRWRRVKEVI